MKISQIPAIGLLLLGGTMATEAKPKTASPVKVRANQIKESPFRFNGAVLTDQFRGSGFCAWNKRTFFSAAHVLYDAEWLSPPLWCPTVNSETPELSDSIQTRGYYRWTEYSALAADSASFAFSQDVILGFAFEKLIPGTPAKINLNGYKDLRKNSQTLITGYPAKNAYLEESIEGFFMHKTGPVVTPYEKYDGNALTTTLVTTGPGNSGGPIWTRQGKSGWAAAGVLVGGLPSESIVYSFTKDINSLTRAVAPVIKSEIGEPVSIDDVSSTSTFFPYNKVTEIPDGRHKWSSFKIRVKSFEDEAVVKGIALSLDIRTPHRGDLQIILMGPGGFQALVHNEGGAGQDNLIFKNKDFSDDFSGILANGDWTLLVQDRLKGDIATLKSIMLEIAVEDTALVPTP